MPQVPAYEPNESIKERQRRLQALSGLDTGGQYVGNESQDFLTDLFQMTPTQELSPLDIVNAAGRVSDYATSAPVRAALGTIGTDESALKAFVDQYGKLPEEAPTGDVLAGRLGLEGTSQGVAGFGIDALSDIQNITPIGALAALGVKSGIKKVGKKAVRKAVLEAAEDLPMDEASRLARAKEMGFNADKVFYHATDANFDTVKKSKFSPDVNYGKGFYVADNPDEVMPYISTGMKEEPKGSGKYIWDLSPGSNIIPVHIKTESTLDMTKPLPKEILNHLGEKAGLSKEVIKDYAKGSGDKFFKSIRPDSLDRSYVTEYLKKLGYDSMSTHDQTVVFEPNQVRSKFAKFDPKQKESSNISAGIGGAALLDQLLQDIDDQQKTDQKNIRTKDNSVMGVRG